MPTGPRRRGSISCAASSASVVSLPHYSTAEAAGAVKKSAVSQEKLLLSNAIQAKTLTSSATTTQLHRAVGETGVATKLTTDLDTGHHKLRRKGGPEYKNLPTTAPKEQKDRHVTAPASEKERDIQQSTHSLERQTFLRKSVESTGLVSAVHSAHKRPEGCDTDSLSHTQKITSSTKDGKPLSRHNREEKKVTHERHLALLSKKAFNTKSHGHSTPQEEFSKEVSNCSKEHGDESNSPRSKNKISRVCIQGSTSSCDDSKKAQENTSDASSAASPPPTRECLSTPYSTMPMSTSLYDSVATSVVAQCGPPDKRIQSPQRDDLADNVLNVSEHTSSPPFSQRKKKRHAAVSPENSVADGVNPPGYHITAIEKAPNKRTRLNTESAADVTRTTQSSSGDNAAASQQCNGLRSPAAVADSTSACSITESHAAAGAHVCVVNSNQKSSFSSPDADALKSGCLMSTVPVARISDTQTSSKCEAISSLSNESTYSGTNNISVLSHSAAAAAPTDLCVTTTMDGKYDKAGVSSSIFTNNKERRDSATFSSIRHVDSASSNMFAGEQAPRVAANMFAANHAGENKTSSLIFAGDKTISGICAASFATVRHTRLSDGSLCLRHLRWWLRRQLRLANSGLLHTEIINHPHVVAAARISPLEAPGINYSSQSKSTVNAKVSETAAVTEGFLPATPTVVASGASAATAATATCGSATGAPGAVAAAASATTADAPPYSVEAVAVRLAHKLICCLLLKEKSSILLLGPPGSGKSAAVALALRTVQELAQQQRDKREQQQQQQHYDQLQQEAQQQAHQQLQLDHQEEDPTATAIPAAATIDKASATSVAIDTSRTAKETDASHMRSGFEEDLTGVESSRSFSEAGPASPLRCLPRRFRQSFATIAAVAADAAESKPSEVLPRVVCAPAPRAISPTEVEERNIFKTKSPQKLGCCEGNGGKAGGRGSSAAASRKASTKYGGGVMTPGSGSSGKLLEELQQQQQLPDLLVVHVYCSLYPNETAMLYTIVQQLSQALRCQQQPLPSASFEELSQMLRLILGDSCSVFSRAVVIVLDHFEACCFTAHTDSATAAAAGGRWGGGRGSYSSSRMIPYRRSISSQRQQLLYCLFDLQHSSKLQLCTVCVSSVLGITDQMEKRIRSRFSLQTLYVGGAAGATHLLKFVREKLLPLTPQQLLRVAVDAAAADQLYTGWLNPISADVDSAGTTIHCGYGGHAHAANIHCADGGGAAAVVAATLSENSPQKGLRVFVSKDEGKAWSSIAMENSTGKKEEDVCENRYEVGGADVAVGADAAVALTEAKIAEKEATEVGDKEGRIAAAIKLTLASKVMASKAALAALPSDAHSMVVMTTADEANRGGKNSKKRELSLEKSKVFSPRKQQLEGCYEGRVKNDTKEAATICKGPNNEKSLDNHENSNSTINDIKININSDNNDIDTDNNNAIGINNENDIDDDNKSNDNDGNINNQYNGSDDSTSGNNEQIHHGRDTNNKKNNSTDTSMTTYNNNDAHKNNTNNNSRVKTLGWGLGPLESGSYYFLSHKLMSPSIRSNSSSWRPSARDVALAEMFVAAYLAAVDEELSSPTFQTRFYRCFDMGRQPRYFFVQLVDQLLSIADGHTEATSSPVSAAIAYAAASAASSSFSSSTASPYSQIRAPNYLRLADMAHSSTSSCHNSNSPLAGPVATTTTTAAATTATSVTAITTSPPLLSERTVSASNATISTIVSNGTSSAVTDTTTCQGLGFPLSGRTNASLYSAPASTNTTNTNTTTTNTTTTNTNTSSVSTTSSAKSALTAVSTSALSPLFLRTSQSLSGVTLYGNSTTTRTTTTDTSLTEKSSLLQTPHQHQQLTEQQQHRRLTDNGHHHQQQQQQQQQKQQQQNQQQHTDEHLSGWRSGVPMKNNEREKMSREKGEKEEEEDADEELRTPTKRRRDKHSVASYFSPATVRSPLPDGPDKASSSSPFRSPYTLSSSPVRAAFEERGTPTKSSSRSISSSNSNSKVATPTTDRTQTTTMQTKTQLQTLCEGGLLREEETGIESLLPQRSLTEHLILGAFTRLHEQRRFPKTLHLACEQLAQLFVNPHAKQQQQPHIAGLRRAFMRLLEMGVLRLCDVAALQQTSVFSAVAAAAAEGLFSSCYLCYVPCKFPAYRKYSEMLKTLPLPGEFKAWVRSFEFCT